MFDQSKFPVKWKEKSTNDKGSIVLVQNARLASAYLASPQIWPQGQGADYNVQMLIPKDNKAFTAAVEKSLKTIVEKSKMLTNKKQADGVLKKAVKFGNSESFLKDGDEITDGEGNPLEKFAGCWVLKAKTKCKSPEGGPPIASLKLVDKRNQSIPRDELEDEFYPGCFADVTIQVKPYKAGANLGITAYLSGVMKIADGERLGGINVFETRDDIEDEEYEETDQL